jgi:hypothetical protein
VAAWRKIFGSYPKLWELFCIFLHDIGICGRQYLSVKGAKNGHWLAGAKIAGYLFGQKGAWLCAGHTSESNFPQSKLFLADKYSWLVAPEWWLWSNFYLEKFEGSISNPVEWKKIIADNLKKNHHFSSHDLYEKETHN